MNSFAPLPPSARLSRRQCVAASAAMAVAVTVATLATPRLQSLSKAPDLDSTVPKAFGQWRVVADSSTQVAVARGVETEQEQPYDQTVMRTYANSDGDEVMLALAWGERQRQDIKVHRPEVCYPAQGYAVSRVAVAAPIKLSGRAEPVPTMHMLVSNRGNYEAVRYWIRIGQSYDGDGFAARWYLLKEGLHGRVPDGILVRASQRIHSPDDMAHADQVMEEFLAQLTAATPTTTLPLLVR